MTIIRLITKIDAPVERVFDLSRSIDAHMESAVGTSEKAVAGVTKGLIGLGEQVTWEARHFALKQKLTVKITEYTRPHQFQDVMISGIFSMMKHDHLFRSEEGGTVMEDLFEFKAPLGVLGSLAEKLFLARYMKEFLLTRNEALKNLAESNHWRRFLEVVRSEAV